MWHVTHQVHLPTLALGVLWIIHSAATTMYVPWQNQRQRGAIEAVTTVMGTSLRLHDDLTELRVLLDDQSRSPRIADLRQAIFQSADWLARQMPDQPAKHLAVELHDQLHQDVADRSELSDPAEIDRLVPLSQQLIESQQQRLLEVIDQRSRTDLVVMVVRAVLLVLGLMVGIGLAIWMARGLQRSISQISISLNSAQGESAADLGRLDVVSNRSTPELAVLDHQVQQIVRKFRGVVGELQQAKNDVIRAERLAAVGQIAAGVAHEIRNPLTSVKLLLQRAAKQQPVHTLNDEQMQVVLEEVSRIESTVTGLLEFARPEPAQKVMGDPQEIIHRTLALLEGQLQRKGAQVTVEPPSSEAMVLCDPRRIQQVLVNLLLNALDSLPAAGSIRIRQQALPTEYVIEIEDSGPGIAPAVLVTLFEPFVTTRPQGSGLGLAISRRIIEEHGGTLTAANSPAGGAVFTIRLPLGPSSF